MSIVIKANAPDAKTFPPLTCVVLMLVTPPELPIARFTIRSLEKLSEIPDLSVVILANGLSSEEEELVATWIKGLKNVSLQSNRDRIEKIKQTIKIGELYVTDAGRSELRVGCYESAPEIWERELPRLNADIVGMIDSDFEIFSGGFLREMIEAFRVNRQLGFMAVDYSPTQPFFDSYSRQNCLLAERYHTWFCLYSRAALLRHSDFSYFETVCENKLIKYDHSARLQAVLSVDLGYQGAVLDRKWGWSFLHYGAFAQNRTLEGVWLHVYRFLRIGRRNGWVHVHQLQFLVKPAQLLSWIGFRVLGLRRYDKERRRYRFEAN